MQIVAATVVSDPLRVLGVDVRNVRMTSPVYGNVVLGRRTGLLTSCWARNTRMARNLRGRWTASRNVSTAKLRGATAV